LVVWYGEQDSFVLKTLAVQSYDVLLHSKIKFIQIFLIETIHEKSRLEFLLYLFYYHDQLIFSRNSSSKDLHLKTLIAKAQKSPYYNET
jgi:hypothetical protein